MKKKILSAALAGALVCSLSGSALAAGFTDTEGHWAASQISRWNGLGIISGYGEMFHPNAAITRGDMAVVLDRIMGYQAKAVNPFSDLPENAYYTSAVLGANAAGVLAGDGATVRPNARCGGDCRVGAPLCRRPGFTRHCRWQRWEIQSGRAHFPRGSGDDSEQWNCGADSKGRRI